MRHAWFLLLVIGCGGATNEVVINGQVLTEDQVAGIEKAYGVRPKAGNYWYDGTSGLYGARGYPAYGFMRPKHNFGPLPADASNGETGVFVNGRQLPAAEWAMWSQIIGTRIAPGRYWFDSLGNAGVEGQRRPLVNFFLAARQNQYRGGGGGGGDNFWSTRFSAGNSDRGGSRGYVSVPGHGPVGYGFD